MFSLAELVRAVYRRRKTDNFDLSEKHPDENLLACYLDDKLEDKEKERIKIHLLHCAVCAESVGLALSIKKGKFARLPRGVIEAVNQFLPVTQDNWLKVVLNLKEKAWEILKSNADLLAGQEIVPARSLRGRKVGAIKEGVILLKDFNRLRLEVRLISQENNKFNIVINVKDKFSRKIKPGLRVALFQEEREIESYATDTGSVTFESVSPGKYRVDICGQDNLAAVFLDVNA